MRASIFPQNISCQLAVVLALTQATIQTSVQGAVTTLQFSDTSLTPSFNAAGHWSDSLAPSAGTDYLVAGGLVLQTPADSNPYTFLGDSLTLGDGTTKGTLMTQGQSSSSIYTISNLILNNGTIKMNSGIATIAGNISVLSGGGTIDQGQGNWTLTITSAISGSGNLTFTNSSGTAGTGLIILSGSTTSTYTGATTIQAGTKVRSANGFGNSSSVTLSGSGAYWDLATGTAKVNNLSGVAGTTIDAKIASGGATLTVNQTINSVFAGNIINSATGGNFHLIKDGAATLTLSGTNTYNGSTTIKNGTLKLDASTGSLLSTTDLIMKGGNFVYDNTNTTSGAKTQTLASVSASAGSNTIQSILGGATTAVLTITAAPGTPSKGATRNFVTTGGVNGVSNSIILAGAAQGLISYSDFFNGTDYAYVDTVGGYVRAAAYGSDATFVNAGSVLTSDSTANYQIAASVSTSGSSNVSTLKFTGTGAVNLTLGSGTFVLANGGIIRSGSGSTLISGGSVIVSANASTSFVINVASVSDSLTIATQLGNAGNALIKTGDGTLFFTAAANNYNGQTYINGGFISTSKNNIGNAAGAQIININNGGIQATGTFSLDHAVVITNSATFDVTDSNILTNSKVVSGSGSLTKIGTGTQILSATNTYTGATTVSAGELDVNGSLVADSTVSVGSGASIGGSGNVYGAVNVANGAIKGNGLTMASVSFTGTSTLAGTSTATSGYTIASGTTNVTGTTSSSVNVSSGLLKGTGQVGNVSVSGTIGGTLTTGTLSGSGVVSPGNSPGILTVASLASGNTLSFAFELSTATPTYSSSIASGNDILHVTNSSSGLSLSSGNSISIYFSSLSNMGVLTGTYEGTFYLEGLSGSSLLTAFNSANTTYYVVDTDGDTIGDVVFSGTYYTTISKNLVTVSYLDKTSSDFGTGTAASTLEFTVVPEPNTWAILVSGFGLLAFGQKLRRCRNA
ncbi:MAG: autotransporter-associated beta strand repeat-containing protein [Chthoniobacteraceae bacterium]